MASGNRHIRPSLLQHARDHVDGQRQDADVVEEGKHGLDCDDLAQGGRGDRDVGGLKRHSRGEREVAEVGEEVSSGEAISSPDFSPEKSPPKRKLKKSQHDPLFFSDAINDCRDVLLKATIPEAQARWDRQETGELNANKIAIETVNTEGKDLLEGFTGKRL